jgi:hypothetical protein
MGGPVQLRAVLSIASLAAFLAAVAALWAFPQDSELIFYVLLGWMFAWLTLLYLPGVRRRVAGAGGPTVSPDSPLASTSSVPPSSSLGFCIYCAAPVEPGTLRCPACGHPLPHFA